MAGRRTVTVLVLVGVGLVIAAAVLGVIVISDWRLKAAAAAAGAVGMFIATSVLPVWLTAAVGQSDQGRPAPGRVYMPGRKLPLVRDITDPTSMGVHAAARTGNGDRVPPYVPRDIDPVLHQALGSSGFILLVGAAATGKTRTAYEAIRALLPGHVFIAPQRDDAAGAIAAARKERNCVLWLDNLQRYLGSGTDAVTRQSIAGLLAGAGHHRVLLATLRAAEENRLIMMAGRLSGGQLMRDGQGVLDLADHRIVVRRAFSDAERARAALLAAQDSRLADALDQADRYGIPEYLSSGPRLYIEWENAWESGANPRGAALVAAAVECRAAGFAAPLPRALLDELQQQYLDRLGDSRLRPEPLDQAWSWATEPRDSGDSLLWLAGPDRYEVFDYLVDVRARQAAEPVPEATVRAALGFASSADATLIGGTALYQDRFELAVAGFRRSYSELVRTDGPDARTTLASRSDLAVTLHAFGKLPDAETEYRVILDRRTAALGKTDPDTLASRNNLATLLHAQRQLPEAEAEYRAILDIRTRKLGDAHPSTLLTRNNLGVVLIDLGRLEEAEAELDEVLRLRSEVLGPSHPHTVITRQNRDTARRKRSGK